MTLSPKEKAEELVDRFYHAKKYANSANAMSIELAKQCAIIACQEIINNFGTRTTGQEFYTEYRAVEYYQQVKTEIENL